MRVYGYSRVSGRGQVEGDGPERQQLSIRKFCERHGLELQEIGFDGGVSGTVDGLERPEFARLIELCQNDTLGQSGAIVVEKLDRLARDLMVQEVLLAECRKSGVAVYAADYGELVDLASCEDDPTRKAFRQMMGVFAEWDKTSTVLKLRAARRRKKQSTGRCEGRKPYGTSECERSVVNIMIERFAQFEDYQDVTEWVNALGITTRSGTPWNRGTVWSILKRHKDEVELHKLANAAVANQLRGEGEEESFDDEPVEGGGEPALHGGGAECDAGGAPDECAGEGGAKGGKGGGKARKPSLPPLQHNPCQKDSILSLLKNNRTNENSAA